MCELIPKVTPFCREKRVSGTRSVVSALLIFEETFAVCCRILVPDTLYLRSVADRTISFGSLWTVFPVGR